jgi:hypothetical protein
MLLHSRKTVGYKCFESRKNKCKNIYFRFFNKKLSKYHKLTKVKLLLRQNIQKNPKSKKSRTRSIKKSSKKILSQYLKFKKS